ncbi:four-carbon acid sugar kinase family protein [Ancylobacter amanitiformis]|nr:four-carbon acid sugar kinase family protein [Ancylobacter amanitiformis]
MTGVRILADDLTGALDSAAAFATPFSPLPVLWRAEHGLPAMAAIDAATREVDGDRAVARQGRFTDWLLAGEPAFKKIDSLMRGNWAAELGALAVMAEGRRLVVAPAFPFQGRVTRAGRQWKTDTNEPLGDHIHAALRQAGLIHADIRVHDAESDMDLDAIVAREMSAHRPRLWVGTGGLAAALARARPAPVAPAGAPPESPRRQAPLLALFGSNHPVTRTQIEHAIAPDPRRHVRLSASPSDIDRVLERLAGGQSCIVTVAFEGTRADAALVIAERFSRLLARCPPPGTLFVAGGETLRDVADAIGAESLAVEGAPEPGLAMSRLRGGRFDGVRVLSKSGAFGRPDLLRELLDTASNGR